MIGLDFPWPALRKFMVKPVVASLWRSADRDHRADHVVANSCQEGSSMTV